MSVLTEFRDHARARATWQPGEPRVACRERTIFGTAKPPDHANCGGGSCGCACHEPTPAERELWRKLADEIDAYLTDDQEPALLPVLTTEEQVEYAEATAKREGDDR